MTIENYILVIIVFLRSDFSAVTFETCKRRTSNFLDVSSAKIRTFCILHGIKRTEGFLEFTEWIWKSNSSRKSQYVQYQSITLRLRMQNFRYNDEFGRAGIFFFLQGSGGNIEFWVRVSQLSTSVSLQSNQLLRLAEILLFLFFNFTSNKHAVFIQLGHYSRTSRQSLGIDHTSTQKMNRMTSVTFL